MKNYQLWMRLKDQSDVMHLSHFGSKEEAYRVFDAQMPGWRDRPDFYVKKV
jgi:hypothetical protein